MAKSDAYKVMIGPIYPKEWAHGKTPKDAIPVDGTFTVDEFDVPNADDRLAALEASGYIKKLTPAQAEKAAADKAATNEVAHSKKAS